MRGPPVVIATETTERTDPRTSLGLLDFPTPHIAAATRGGVVGAKNKHSLGWGVVFRDFRGFRGHLQLPALSAC